MQQNHQISRSNVNKSIVNAQDFPKSGFNLTYNSYGDYMLGRLHPTGFQYVMPSDKFSGRNEGNLTFNRLVTPQVSQVEGRQDNFFVTFRSIDKTFEEAFAPNKNNAMSASWHVPTFNLKAVIRAWVSHDRDVMNLFDQVLSATSVTQELVDAVVSFGDVSSASLAHINRLYAGNYTGWSNMYMTDYLPDYFAYYNSRVAGMSSVTALRDLKYAFLDGVFTPLFGENSLLDVLGYNYLRKNDLYNLSRLNVAFSVLVNSLDETPMSEYPLRAYYAIWYEYYRDVNLEPVSANLPKWKEFGSASVIDTYGVAMLAVRVRSWQTDMFTSSMPDDICRHVFAPILTSGDVDVVALEDPHNYLNAETYDAEKMRDIVSYNLSYRDSVSGSTRQISCPLPASVNDALGALSSQTDIDVFHLDLLTLRRAQMLEQYLKRNFYFGDEYRDRMLAHYGSRVSDMRVNRPELLSSSISMIDLNQQVANVGTGIAEGQSQAGDRVVTATMSTNGDGYQFFAEEFGIVLNIVSFMPRAQYAGVCGQHLMYLQKDFPVPEFANQNEEFGRVMEVASNGLAKTTNTTDGGSLGMFGHYPYAHAWRSRVDEVHGSYLSDKQNYTFRRYFGFDPDGGFVYPKLNAEFLHCHPNLGMFANTVLLDGQLYGSFKHNFYVERVLPTPVENI